MQPPVVLIAAEYLPANKLAKPYTWYLTVKLALSTSDRPRGATHLQSQPVDEGGRRVTGARLVTDLVEGSSVALELRQTQAVSRNDHDG
jgi:hypothetical protein